MTQSDSTPEQDLAARAREHLQQLPAQTALAPHRPQNATSTRTWPRATARLTSRHASVVVGGMELSGMSTTVAPRRPPPPGWPRRSPPTPGGRAR